MTDYCHLGGELNVSGRSEAAVTAPAIVGWAAFKKCGELLHEKTKAYVERRKVYCSCVRLVTLC